MKHISMRAGDKSKLMSSILFSALHLHLTNWSRCDGAESRSAMIGTREFSLSFQPHSNGSRFISPIIPMSQLVDVLEDYDNKQLLELVATLKVEYHLWLSYCDMSYKQYVFGLTGTFFAYTLIQTEKIIFHK